MGLLPQRRPEKKTPHAGKSEERRAQRKGRHRPIPEPATPALESEPGLRSREREMQQRGRRPFERSARQRPSLTCCRSWSSAPGIPPLPGTPMPAVELAAAAAAS